MSFSSDVRERVEIELRTLEKVVNQGPVVLATSRAHFLSEMEFITPAPGEYPIPSFGTKYVVTPTGSEILDINSRQIAYLSTTLFGSPQNALHF